MWALVEMVILEVKKAHFEGPISLHLLPAGVCLASTGEACCCRVISPQLPTLTS